MIKCEVQGCGTTMVFRGVVGTMRRHVCPKCGKTIDLPRGDQPRRK